MSFFCRPIKGNAGMPYGNAPSIGDAGWHKTRYAILRTFWSKGEAPGLGDLWNSDVSKGPRKGALLSAVAQTVAVSARCRGLDRITLASVLTNEELGTKIYSFPMKYVPLDAKDRTHTGRHWNRQLIRGVQCILLATRGMVTPRREFFEAAFGRTADEFIKIISMPEHYIIYRRHHEKNGAHDWGRLYNRLAPHQRRELLELVCKNRVDEANLARVRSQQMRNLLAHYVRPER